MSYNVDYIVTTCDILLSHDMPHHHEGLNIINHKS